MQCDNALTVARGAAAVSLLLCCSCQSLPRDAKATTTRPDAPVGAQNTSQSQSSAAAANQALPTQRPMVQRPPMPQSPIQQVGHYHSVGHGGGHCPCCGPGTLPPFAFSGLPTTSPTEPWMPDAIKGPWPKDEYVCDGSDLNHDVRVKADGTVVGLDQQDTIAHYNTRDGRTEVTSSNCVCIYAPRFAAIRQVSVPVIYEGHERMAGVEKPTKLNVHEERRGPRTAAQPEQIIAQVGLDQVQRFRDRTQGLLVDQATRLELAADAFLPHEDLLFIQRGQFDASEKARLAQRVAAAETWTNHQAPQVLVEGVTAVEMRGTSTPQVTYTYETGGKPCLRLCKIADKSEANVGEIVTFTLRFDNVGDEQIKNVTIIDNLMPRMEYVAGSAQSAMKAEFSKQEQLPGESLVLRWDISEPLEVNAGGIVRFQARVR